MDVNQLIEDFKWFHTHPELSYEEYETTKKIKDLLEQEDITILSTNLKTGLVAQVGTGNGPVVALRCDIDALPIQEETNLPYKSQVAGKMHACGHDFHIATLLGAARLLKSWEGQLKGTIKLIFQPAEEAPGGAKKVIETGVLDDVSHIFGLHVSPLLPVGQVGIRVGADSAAVDAFKLIFKGKGCHAAHPEMGIDPIVAATQFVNAVQTVVSRNVNPFAPNLVSITHIEAGNTWNVIPESAFIEGTARTTTKADRNLVKSRILDLAKNIGAAYGVDLAVDWYEGPPATQNAADLENFVRDCAGLVGLEVTSIPGSLGGEDFSYYQEKIKGFFVHIGTGLSNSLHNPKFQVDPQSLAKASLYMATLGKKILEDEKTGSRV